MQQIQKQCRHIRHQSSMQSPDQKTACSHQEGSAFKKLQRVLAACSHCSSVPIHHLELCRLHLHTCLVFCHAKVQQLCQRYKMTRTESLQSLPLLVVLPLPHILWLTHCSQDHTQLCLQLQIAASSHKHSLQRQQRQQHSPANKTLLSTITAARLCAAHIKRCCKSAEA